MSANIHGQTVNASGVVVAQNGTTTQNFAIPAITFYTVSGVVSETGSGTGVPAMLMVANQEQIAPVWASATEAPGAYSIMLPAGTWSLLISHPGYDTATQSVTVAGNMTPEHPAHAARQLRLRGQHPGRRPHLQLDRRHRWHCLFAGRRRQHQPDHPAGNLHLLRRGLHHDAHQLQRFPLLRRNQLHHCPHDPALRGPAKQRHDGLRRGPEPRAGHAGHNLRQGRWQPVHHPVEPGGALGQRLPGDLPGHPGYGH
ncbi:MAG: carboxypeptidase regulatory-like domain-containing protein [Anaerolineae bacterium]